MSTSFRIIPLSLEGGIYTRTNLFFSFAYRRADGDAPDDQPRLYELAGSTHDTITIFQNFAPDADIIKARVTPPNPAVCGYQYITGFPYEYYFNAAAVNLKLWSRGIKPPYADRFQYDKVALYTTQLVKERFLLPIDAPKIITEAAQANVP